MQHHWTIQDGGSLAMLLRQEHGPPRRPAHFTQIPRVSISHLDPTSSVWKQILEPVQRLFKFRLEIFSARVCVYADSIAAKVFENPTLVYLDCLCPSTKLPKGSCTLLCLSSVQGSAYGLMRNHVIFLHIRVATIAPRVLLLLYTMREERVHSSRGVSFRECNYTTYIYL